MSNPDGDEGLRYCFGGDERERESASDQRVYLSMAVRQYARRDLQWAEGRSNMRALPVKKVEAS